MGGIRYEPIPKNNGTFNIKKESFNDVKVPWHVHAEYELTFISMVNGSEHIGSHFSVINQDEVILVGPFLPHNWQRAESYPDALERRYYDYQICIHFAPDLFGKDFFNRPPFLDIQELLKKCEYGISFKGKAVEHIKNIMNDMLEMSDYDRCIAFIGLLHYMANLQSVNVLSSFGFRDSDNTEKMEKMDKIVSYIAKNYRKEITLNELADMAVMTPQAFSSYFKKRTGKSPINFINEVRVANACMLLHNEEIGIVNVCYTTGFNSMSNFNRQFKKVTGVSPQVFKYKIRKQVREEVE